jgi:hypothetical protein
LGQVWKEAERMQSYNGELNFATDAWTSPNHKAFVVLTVHLEQDGTPLCLVLDIVEVAQVWTYHDSKPPFTDKPIPQSHSGLNLATAFAKILQEFGIVDKVSIKTHYKSEALHLQQILSITCNNASCNNVMITELAKILPSFSEVGHTQCFLHIVNLVAKSIIRQFDIQKK